MQLFAPLRKVDTAADGSLYVEGIASAEVIDSAGELVKADAIKAALPDYLRGGTGALREMHQPIAAGLVTSVSIEGGVTKVSATVVDVGSIAKVRAGVLKGFSIGGKVLARDAKDRKTITKIRLSEISLVDRPACPDAVLTLWKADGRPSPDQVRQALDALPAEDRALVLVKAALTRPRSIGVWR